jgi:uncharacterized protein YggE
MKSLFARSVVLLGFSVLACSASVSAATTEPSSRRVVTITAQDVVRIPATLARLTAMVEMQAESPAAAQASIRQRSQTVLDFLQRAKVDRLQAGAMALDPVYGERVPQPGSGLVSGVEVIAYRAQWSASFEVEATRAGEITDGVVSTGAARIGSFEFTATPDALATAQQEALKGAATKARANAHSVLGALGYQRSDVVRVDVNSSDPVQPLGRRAEMLTMAADPAMSPTAVQPGMIEVVGSVTLEVAY